ncbi:MAG: hypothetical protein PHR81_08400, partial [Bacteroidales bacterium]|nr:hypothetical protein [Bacteroidales bacterium]
PTNTCFIKNINVAIKFLLFVLLAFITLDGYSQTKTYTWDVYKIKFKVPETFTVEITSPTSNII